eukprot:356940-Chlamydomonas_euryale.AAC.6
MAGLGRAGQAGRELTRRCGGRGRAGRRGEMHGQAKRRGIHASRPSLHCRNAAATAVRRPGNAYFGLARVMSQESSKVDLSLHPGRACGRPPAPAASPPLSPSFPCSFSSLAERPALPRKPAGPRTAPAGTRCLTPALALSRFRAPFSFQDDARSTPPYAHTYTPPP